MSPLPEPQHPPIEGIILPDDDRFDEQALINVLADILLRLCMRPATAAEVQAQREAYRRQQREQR